MNVGNKVTWMHTGQSGRQISMRTREGTITAINGNIATVRPPNKRTRPVLVHVSRLRLDGQRTELTENVDAIFEANRKAKGES